MDISLSRKLAILRRLSDKPATFSELAAIFGGTWQEIRNDLQELFTVELSEKGFFESPIDLIFDLAGGPDSVVQLVQAPHWQPTYSFAEVIAVLAAVDNLIATTDPAAQTALRTLRADLVTAATAAGYGESLWPAPQNGVARAVYGVILESLLARQKIRISYWKAAPGGAQPYSYDIYPVDISTAGKPRLIAANDRKELREYRLDRIGSAELIAGTVSKNLVRRIRQQWANAEPEFGGIKTTLWCEQWARWVAESVPATTEIVAGLLRIELDARPEWLLELAMQLGTGLQKVEDPYVAHQLAQAADILAQEYQ
ncbi:MAG: WYL domain-containing protein [Trueperella sp.]|nr:WYL domain-containing protein [Trueperella sp.]